VISSPILSGREPRERMRERRRADPMPHTKRMADRELERLAYSPTEVTQLLGLSIDSVRRHMRTGRLPSVRLGRRRLIPRDVLLALLRPEIAPQTLARWVRLAFSDPGDPHLLPDRGDALQREE